MSWMMQKHFQHFKLMKFKYICSYIILYIATLQQPYCVHVKSSLQDGICSYFCTCVRIGLIQSLVCVHKCTCTQTYSAELFIVIVSTQLYTYYLQPQVFIYHTVTACVFTVTLFVTVITNSWKWTLLQVATLLYVYMYTECFVLYLLQRITFLFSRSPHLVAKSCNRQIPAYYCR